MIEDPVLAPALESETPAISDGRVLTDVMIL